jgi:hypothetical protein
METDLALEGDAGVGIHRRAHRLADLQLAERLLRHVEVDVDGVERLQRDHGGAGGQVLAFVDLTNPELPANGARTVFSSMSALLRDDLRAGGFQVRASVSTVAWLMACAASCS